jgi:hypothetical protein
MFLLWITKKVGKNSRQEARTKPLKFMNPNLIQ